MKRGFLFCVSIVAFWAAACSSGGGKTIVPPPPGGFTNENLKGTYVFSMSGRTVDQNFGVSNFARIGTFIADGLGGISNPGGIEDIHIFGTDNIIGFTGGSYTVNSDGRGTLSLINSSGTSVYSITLASSSSGYIVAMPTDNSSTASGNFLLQTATTLATNTYTFDFSGIAPDDTGNPISIIGEFTPNGGGGITATSFADVNENGNLVSKTALSNGTLVMDNSNLGTGRGTATIGAFSYIFYVVDSQHVQFMGSNQDANAPGTLLGEAIAQQAGVPNNVSAFNKSSFVFVMGGSGLGTGAGGPLTRAGRLTATGANLSAISLDNNNVGMQISVPKSGVLSAGTVALDGDNSGRGTFTFTDTVNNTGTYTFVFYLSSASQGVIQDVSTVTFNGSQIPVDVADGTLAAQTGGPFASGGLATNYAVTWSGVTSDEEDFVGQFAPATASPNGLMDGNEFGQGKEFLGVPLGGVITFGGDGTGSTGQHSTFVATLQKPTVNAVNFFAYVANPSTIYIMSTGTQRVAVGVLTAQTP